MRTGSVTRLSLGLIAWLAVLWLVLNQTVAPGQVALAVVLAVAVSWAVSPLRPLRASIRKPRVVVALLFTVLADVVRGNIGVARVVLGLVRGREVRSGFLDIPLDLRDPHGLAGLAMIVTATPGTLWTDLAPDGSRVTLHILDLEDEEASRRWIKERYEQPLMRIFE